ncbi:MAG TPA: response regulator [Gemmatimonadaceae bacterium]|nr:response regulator [Gemmatimonadaceae bacterium]
MPIRALIADDEPLARAAIHQLLASHPDVTVVAEARDGREALRMLKAHAPDLVFLDVQMPEMDAFDVIRVRGPEHMPLVVFVTAFDHFAVRAFEAHSLDYLVKPVTQERLDLALERVRERRTLVEAAELARRFSALLSERAKPAQRILVPAADGELLINAREIDWIEAED